MILNFVGSSRSSQTQRRYPTVIEELCHHFSLADLMKSTNNFHESRIVGVGGFGKVYKGCLPNGEGIAVRVMTAYGLRECKNEIELLCQLRHPNLISLIGFCKHKNSLLLVFDYMSNGSLHDHLYNRDNMEPLSWKKRLEICIGAARGLHYLHSGTKRTIFHRDIKPENILLDSNMVPKLSDFGLSLQGPRFTSKPKPIDCDSVIGTFGYIAPEFAGYGTLTDKCDVYSFGRALLEVVCEKDRYAILDMEPFESEELESSIAGGIADGDTFDSVERHSFEENMEPFLMGKIAPECWEIFMDITVRCLKKDPNERPIMGEVEVQLEHALSLQEEADIRKTCDDYTLCKERCSHSFVMGGCSDSLVTEGYSASFAPSSYSHEAEENLYEDAEIPHLKLMRHASALKANVGKISNNSV